MGKPSDPTNSQPADAVSLHSNPAQGEAFPPYNEEDAAELNIVSIDDLPPVYDDAVASSSSEPLLAASAPATAAREDCISDIFPFRKDTNGPEYYVESRLEDPVVLEKHTRYLATLPPRPYIRVVGTHNERHKKSDNRTETRRVTDFDVRVEMTPYLYSDAQYRRSWSHLRTAENGEKTRRGTILKKRAKGATQNIEVGGDPKPPLEEWCHRFCASHAGLKCFTLRREVTGFDFPEVRHRLIQLVQDTNYRGNLDVQWVTGDETVEMYNETHTNRWRLTTWIRTVCFFTLMFIFTWPWLFFRTRRWEVVVAEWPFSRIKDGSRSEIEYVSLSEQQWYNMWARAIVKAVVERRQTTLDQADLRRAQLPEPSFDSGNTTVNGAVGLFRAGLVAMNEVNRQLGWGGDC